MRTCLAVFLIVLVLTPASAHGFLVRAVPDDRAVLDRPPARVQYWFSEGLEPAFSRLTVRDANGTVVAEGGTDPDNVNLLGARLPSDLPDGAYIADLRLAFASDGHVIAETRVFFIGAEVAGISGGVDAQADPIEAAWRAATLVGLMLSFGTAAAYTRVMLPAWGSAAHPAGGLPPRVMSRLTLLMVTGLALAIAAQIAALLHQSVVFFGVGLDTVLGQSLWSVVRTSTRFGEVWNARMLVLIVCAAMMAFGWLNRRTQPELTRPMWSAAFWGLIIALGASSVISHAAGSRTAAWAALILDWLHLLAVALWVGGLAALVLTLPAALAPLDAEGKRKALLAALRRFSPIAAGCLAVVIGTGIFSASLWVRPADVATTGYGLTLVVKLAMVAGLAGLGAVHFQGLRAEGRGSSENQRTGRWQLLSSLRLEVVFGLLALIGAGWLTATPVPVPPDALRAIAPLTASVELPAASGQQPAERVSLPSGPGPQPSLLSVTLSPGGPGVNTVDMQVTRGGESVEGLTAEMQVVQPSRDVRSAWSGFEPLGGGAYATVTPDIDRAGEWWSLIDLTTPDGQTLRAAFTWDIRAEAAVEQGVPLNVAQGGALVLALAAIGYAIGPFARWAYRKLDLTPFSVAVAVVALVGSVAALIAGGAIIDQNQASYEATINPPPAIVNAVLPNADSLARGATLFAEACAWPPDAAGWRELASRLPRTRDEELFAFTRDGFRGLPACAALTDAQRWDVVNHLRAVLRTERVS